MALVRHLWYNNAMEFRLKTSKRILHKPIFVVPATVVGIILLCFVSLIIWKPGIARGEYDIQSIVDMLLNHDARISDIENRLDSTQTQTNQNSEDITKIQENTNTSPASTVSQVVTPVTTVPAPITVITTTTTSITATTTKPTPIIIEVEHQPRI
jgi:predicted PurR-regulated permease PerM